MDFIFMLTRGDKTVEDCLSVFDEIAPLGLKHVGFKDVGVELSTLVESSRHLRADPLRVARWFPARTTVSDGLRLAGEAEQRCARSPALAGGRCSGFGRGL